MAFDPSQDDRALSELDSLADEFVAVERELAEAEARRAVILSRANEWAAEYADVVIAQSESTGRRRELAHRTMVAELATRARMSERTLARHVSDAVALGAMPAVLRELAAGAITGRHVAVIVDEVASLSAACDPAPERHVLIEFEQAVLDVALAKTPAETRRRSRRLREKLAPQTIAERHERARDERRVYVEAMPDGMAWWHALVPADVAIMSHCGLTTCAMGLDDDPDDLRTLDQRRADLFAEHLMQLETGYIVHSAGGSSASKERARPKVLPSMRLLVTVPVLTLAGLSEEPGELDGYGPIPPEMARRMVAHAPSLTRVLTHPVTGTVLDVDRTVYKVPNALRTWLVMRDGTCRFPGCSRRAMACDTDHNLAWEHGGRTSCDNLAHFCRKHHGLKHKAGWQVLQSPETGGVLEWLSPAGRRYRTEPATEMSVYGSSPGTSRGSVASGVLSDASLGRSVDAVFAGRAWRGGDSVET